MKASWWSQLGLLCSSWYRFTFYFLFKAVSLSAWSISKAHSCLVCVWWAAHAPRSPLMASCRWSRCFSSSSSCRSVSALCSRFISLLLRSSCFKESRHFGNFKLQEWRSDPAIWVSDLLNSRLPRWPIGWFRWQMSTWRRRLMGLAQSASFPRQRLLELLRLWLRWVPLF